MTLCHQKVFSWGFGLTTQVVFFLQGACQLVSLPANSIRYFSQPCSVHLQDKKGLGSAAWCTCVARPAILSALWLLFYLPNSTNNI